MTIQAHLDKIRAKTGNSPKEFRALAAELGLTTYRSVKDWLTSEYGLDHGHANLVAHLVVTADQPEMSTDERVAARFSGNKATGVRPMTLSLTRKAGRGPTSR